MVIQSRRAAVSDIRRVSNNLAFTDSFRRGNVHRERTRRLRRWRQRAVIHYDALHASSRYFDFARPKRSVGKFHDDVVRAGFEFKRAIVSERLAVRLTVNGQKQT